MHSKPSQLTMASLRFVLTLLGVGFLVGLAGTAHAQLTSPAVVAAGTTIGTGNFDLGRQSGGAFVDISGGIQYASAWYKHGQMNRRIVYVNPEGTVGGGYLVAAYVNTNDCTGLGSSKCRLEFRQSNDKGMTWRPIDGALSPIIVDGGYAENVLFSMTWFNFYCRNSLDCNFDYNLQVGPNGRDLWVSYVKEYRVYYPSSNVETRRRVVPNAVIRKLAWTSNKATWVYGSEVDVERQPTDGDGATEDSATTSFFVQPLAGDQDRLWAVTYHHFSLSGPPQQKRQYSLVHCDNAPAECQNESQWESRNIVDIFEDGGLTKIFQSDAKFILFPIGYNKLPGLITSIPDECTNLGSHVIFRFPGGDGSVGSLPNYTGNVGLTSKRAYKCTTPETGDPSVVPFDFSLATHPTGDAASEMIFTHIGGRSDGENLVTAAGNSKKVTVFTSAIDKDGLDGISQITALSAIGVTDFESPSAGFYGNNGYVVAKRADGGGSQLYYATEPTIGSAAALADSGPVKFAVATPTWTDSAFTLNSGLPPIMWAIAGQQRIAFSANVGGTTDANTNSLLPVMGFGWASNFGWLSMNCASLPVNPCIGNGLYGVGIGIDAAKDTPTNLPVFSPTSTLTYPLGGYAWSSNAGFLSFERKDSVCDTAAGCVDGEDNDFGNPPGHAYHNSTTSTDATAKYDRSTQHVYGWGRFLNLCNYEDEDGAGPGTVRVCFDKDDGWVRMRGFWANVGDATKSAPITTLYTSPGLTLSVHPTQRGDFGPLNSTGTLRIGDEYAAYTRTDPTLTLQTALVKDYPNGTTIYNVTGQEYGVDAFWVGNHYEFSGWAWSQEYGWIRFNPLIFIGYAWLESLFGNIYVGENFQLPDAQRLDGTTVKKCDTNGDGTLEECFVSTYRIEAGGAISSLSYAPGLSVSSGTSASKEYLESLTGIFGACGFGSSTAEDCSRLIGSPDLGLLSLGRNTPTEAFTFPTVQPSTSTYRNALGKLDVGELTTSVTTATSFDDVISGKKVSIGANRFGHALFMAEYKGGAPVDWTIGELLGQSNLGSCNALPCLFGWVWPLEKLQNQVVHVQGDLTVGYDPNPLNKAETTFVGIVRDQVAGGTLTVGSTTNFPTTGTLIINTGEGEAKEEYLSYTGITDATHFSGVKTIDGAPTIEHSGGATVRWVWRWPYVDTATTKLPQNLTIVVDGDLKIHYNIIASDRANDDDLTGAAALSSIGIKNAHSVAFIVRGDVVIAKEVNRITGAFIVISRDTNEEPDTKDDQRSTACSDTHPLFTGCGGAFDTGEDADPAFCNSSDTACNPLTIEGLLFARQFNFARSGALETIDVPAERVIFDQRLFLNPPPGLEDLTKALPNPTRQIP